MRELLSTFLVSEAERDKQFFVFSGDHGYALFDALRTRRPQQFINAGVSEQGMVGYAAGMTEVGFRCVVYGLAAFVPMRVLEFIKLDICHNNRPVLFLGDGAGLVYNTLGASHQCAEDIAVLRCLPAIKIFSPADKFELDFCLRYAVAQKCPTYLRIGKSDKPMVHSRDVSYDIEGLLPVRGGSKETALVATGSMVSTALDIAAKLDLPVFSVPCLSELSGEKVTAQLKGMRHIVSLEEHSIFGGLGSILAELFMERNETQASLLRLGIKNRFTEKCGSYEYAIREHGLDAEALLAEMRAREVV